MIWKLSLLLALTVIQSAIAQNQPRFNSRIAFVQGPDIFSMNPDGSDIRQLTHLGPNNGSFFESWSPDGRQLVFSEYPTNNPGQLWLMNADGSDQHLLLSEPGFFDEVPEFSPDGAWVIFRRCGSDGCAIYKVRTDGSGLTPVTDFQPAIVDWEAEYSPDGMAILFESFNREGLIAASWLMNADGSGLRPVTPPRLLAIDPQWSPDGEKIAFASHCCNAETSDIWVVNRDGSDPHRLTGSPANDLAIPSPYSNNSPSWSPHGRAIVFDQFTPSTKTNAIIVINADGSGRTQLMTRTAAPSRVSAQARLEEQRRHGRQIDRLRQIETGGVWPRWSPELQ
jgi:Tol biopolymer transport system component